MENETTPLELDNPTRNAFQTQVEDNNSFDGTFSKSDNNSLDGTFSKNDNNSLDGTFSKSDNNSIDGTFSKSDNNSIDGTFSKSDNNSFDVTFSKSDKDKSSEIVNVSFGIKQDPPSEHKFPTQEEMHDEMDLILDSIESTREAYELFATDPEYYIYIIQNYHQRRDGSEIYLPNLFNILISRSDGHLRIKFKLRDDDPWEEVGFDSDKYTDSDVYREFSGKIMDLLCRPIRKSNVEEQLCPDAQTEMVNSVAQGKSKSQRRPVQKKRRDKVPLVNQNQTSKLDKFRKPAEEYTEYVPAKKLNMPSEPIATRDEHEFSDAESESDNYMSQECRDKTKSVRFAHDNKSTKSISLDNHLRDYIKETGSTHTHDINLLRSLSDLMKFCPTNGKNAYRDLLDDLKSDIFTRELVGIMGHLESPTRGKLITFLKKFHIGEGVLDNDDFKILMDL